jgi:putative transposase
MDTQDCVSDLQGTRLNLLINSSKRRVRKKPEVLKVPQGINKGWSMDFMHDQIEEGRKFSLFIVTDDFNRVAIAGKLTSHCLQGG